jgi:D-lyxose ketol-isomerase
MEEMGMKRSEINQYIREAAKFFEANHFQLPPWTNWTPEQWKKTGSEADELRAQGLGWDVTDFASGQFKKRGLTLITVRNGHQVKGGPDKVYCEKIMHVREKQVTPYHYHEGKTEDIINRGGKSAGRLAVQLYNAAPDGTLAKTPISVCCDGIRRTLEAGGIVYLGPGESITLTPHLYHQFYAVDGDAIVGEVSSVNDDATDNYFLEKLPRFPSVEEDEAPYRLLCTDYKIA